MFVAATPLIGVNAVNGFKGACEPPNVGKEPLLHPIAANLGLTGSVVPLDLLVDPMTGGKVPVPGTKERIGLVGKTA